MKPRIFIGSSTEGLNVASFIQAELNKDFECILWNDGDVFGENSSYFDSLLKAASMFDFGILVATKDDETEKRKKSFSVPRDNVIFEFGLFIGRLGKNRTFVIQEKGVELPSDLLGIQISDFDKVTDPSKSESLKKVIDRFKQIIIEKYRQQDLGLLPSTGIAIGCFNNFIVRVCKFLFESGAITINGQSFNKFEVHIILPKRLQQNMMAKAKIYYAKRNFIEHTFVTPDGRTIGTTYNLEKSDKGILVIGDMPTTLSALFDAIKMYLQKGSLGPSKEQELIEARELSNFKLALMSLVGQDPVAMEFIKFVEEE